MPLPPYEPIRKYKLSAGCVLESKEDNTMGLIYAVLVSRDSSNTSIHV